MIRIECYPAGPEGSRGLSDRTG